MMRRLETPTKLLTALAMIGMLAACSVDRQTGERTATGAAVGAAGGAAVGLLSGGFIGSTARGAVAGAAGGFVYDQIKRNTD